MSEVQTFQYDVIVVGGGMAALAAAISAKETGASVAIVSKGKVGMGGSSVLTNAVFSAIFSQGDSPEVFLQDMIEGSRYLADQKLAKVLVEECTYRVNELETKYRIVLEREKKIATPGHSFPRRVYAEKGQGRNVTTAMRKYAMELGVVFHEQATLVDLLESDGAVCGALFAAKKGWAVFYASAVILATGGFGGLYASTDNPRDVSGEGIGLAYRHGAKLVDMEFIQFYPYRLKTPANIDVLTKIFGKGAYLLNEKNERFMASYQRKELETRDVLCYAMYQQNKVLLDFSRVAQADLEQDSPQLFRLTRKKYSGDWVMQPVQHYCMGGIQTDEWGRTGVPGLYACGECTGGLHGANRLAGGSVTEILVFAPRVGKMAAEETVPMLPDKSMINALFENCTDVPESVEQDILKKVKDIMWTKVGIERSTDSLVKAANELSGMLSQIETVNDIWGQLLTDKLRTAWAVAYAGSLRTESRGAHRLQNIKEERMEWQKKIVIQQSS
ncbi:FAD-dependent oxidoreductase [Bacillus rubiinfantis]|uniref:FAD-dependent oxidoreductase n=1 Tax=Bacillus rubiinfantis TaxID=1499680 RepID=UPI0005AB4980|nr:FAD-dependent oxidoreductase [Bacillus rubiinfantis]